MTGNEWQHRGELWRRSANRYESRRCACSFRG